MDNAQFLIFHYPVASRHPFASEGEDLPVKLPLRLAKGWREATG